MAPRTKLRRQQLAPPDLAAGNQWLRLLGAQSKLEEQVPADWHTVRQIAEQTGYSIPHVSHLLRRSADVETRKFRIRTGERIIPVPHYRIKAP